MTHLTLAGLDQSDANGWMYLLTLEIVALEEMFGHHDDWGHKCKNLQQLLP